MPRQQFHAVMIDILASMLAIILTFTAFFAARALGRMAASHPLLNPILWGAVIVGVFLWALDIGVADYIHAARPLMQILDLAIVALGFSLVQQLARHRRTLFPALCAVAIGGLVGIGSAILGARLLGLPTEFVQALGAKGISSGFAIALMERLGGPPPLAAGLVIITGMVGALIVPPLLHRLGMDDEATGLGTGASSHIVGTDFLVRTAPEAAAWAALALAFAGLVGAVLLPLFWPLTG
ncbi:LrgB family protein [Pacificimonas sp. ICDLI1SI03]